MPVLSPLYTNRAAQAFREAIRPSLLGQLQVAEQPIAVRAASELGAWLVDVVDATIRTTRLKDEKGEVYKQLMSGIRVTGRSSLKDLTGRISVYPWIRPHEFGAHIVPRNANWLTIPFAYGVHPDGRAKFRNAISWKRFGSFVYTDKKTDKKYIAYRGASGDLRILYILVDDVTIRPRLGLIRRAESMLPRLMSVWGDIYLQEYAKLDPIKLWNRTR